MLLLLAGCVKSKVDPEADVTLRGTLRLADGSPAADVWVGLLRVPDLGEVLFQGLVVAGTFGIPCLSPEPPPVCKTVQSTRTNADGEYVFRLRGADVRGTFGQAVSFQLSAVAPGRSGLPGPSIDTGFEIQREELSLPAMRFWEPSRLTATAGEDRVTVDWSAIDDATGASGPYEVHFTGDEPAAALVWQQPAGPGDWVDARAIADLRGTVHVTAHSTTDGPDTTFRTTYGSQRIGVRGAAGPPASRGSACWEQSPDGPVRHDPCTLTDGSYAQSFPEFRCDAGQPDQAAATPSACTGTASPSVDLGSRRPIGAVFAHHLALSGEAIVEVSDDGQRWTEHGRLSGGFGMVDLDRATGRYVRLRPADSTATITALHELSVWVARADS